MVFLGGAPAALIGVATIASAGCAGGRAWSGLLNNLVAYAWFPLVGGIVFTTADRANLTSQRRRFFYLSCSPLFVLALAVNVAVIAVRNSDIGRGIEHPRLVRKAVMAPVWTSELPRLCWRSASRTSTSTVGLAAIALVGLVMFTFQHLLGQLLLSAAARRPARGAGSPAPGAEPASSRPSRSAC